jgi:hypothetical protein
MYRLPLRPRSALSLAAVLALAALFASEAEAEAQAQEPAPASPLSASDGSIDWNASPVMRVLGRMAENLTDSEYTHGFRVNERAGVYAFDCSGMAHWVLRRAAPRAAATTAHGLSGRPLARD